MIPDALTAPLAGTAESVGHRIRTRSGRVTVTRRAEAADLAAVNAMHGRCSPQTLFSRYQTGRFRQGMSWVTSPENRPDVVVAITHLLQTGVDGRGELALLVEDGWQDVGLGTALARWALSQAPLSGVRQAMVVTTRDNRRMTAICNSLSAHVEPAEALDGTRDGGNVVHFVLVVPGGHASCARHARRGSGLTTHIRCVTDACATRTGGGACTRAVAEVTAAGRSVPPARG